jgi:NTE family protein
MATKINLALQGGGSHGAYTWGVLDRLLEEEDIEINAISGTSAGAMNAVVLVGGYGKGGRAGAKKKLEQFWSRVSELGYFLNPVRQTELEHFTDGWNIDNSPLYQWSEMMTRMFSPYQLNPYNLNPMRNLLSEIVDWDQIENGNKIGLFVTATAVNSGQARVFRCHEVTEDVLLASACIPFFSQAVEIEGEPYWDGGYTGNPSIWPLIYNTDVKDVLLVQINPITREGTPKSAHEIINRLNEISFNASLIGELRAINFVSKLVQKNHLDEAEYKDMRMHIIPAPDASLGLNASSKSNTDMKFLTFLRDAGRKSAEAWLKANKADIGVKATVNIDNMFLKRAREEQAKSTDTPKRSTGQAV